MNYYITLISSKEYFLSALVLNASLKQVKSKYPLVVALTEDLNVEPYLSILAHNEIKNIIIPKLSYPQTANLLDYIQLKPLLINTASKLALFSLNDENKYIYLDSDMFIRFNIDNLFEYPDGALLSYSENDIGLSGLFVFIPKNHNYDFYKVILSNTNGALDGYILDSLFFPFKSNPSYRIPAEKYFTEDIYLKDSNPIFHWFGNNKPFLMSPIELKKCMNIPAYKMYLTYYLPIKLQYENL